MWRSLINDYGLTFKLQLVKLLEKQTPKEWEQGTKGIIILVPGFLETFVHMKSLGNHLNKIGFQIKTIKNYNSKKPIKELALELEQLISKTNDPRLFIIAHSKGGLVAKYILDNSAATSVKIKKIITIAVPFQGSNFAKLRFANLTELDPKNMHNINNNRDYSKITNIYPVIDNFVLPNKSLTLQNASKNIMIDIIGHTQILEHKLTKNAIEKMLI